MAKRMVTVATFDQPPKAHLAQNALRAAGIPAVVTDEAIVTADWMLSNAVGWIKLQVWEEDAERAVTVLEGEFGADGEKLDPIDEDQLAAEAEAAGREDDDEELKATVSTKTLTPAVAPARAAEDGYEPPSERDEYARRLFATAYLGLAFPPVSLYALVLFFKAAFGPGKLSPRGRYNLFVGGVLTAPWPLVFLIALPYMIAR